MSTPPMSPRKGKGKDSPRGKPSPPVSPTSKGASFQGTPKERNQEKPRDAPPKERRECGYCKMHGKTWNNHRQSDCVFFKLMQSRGQGFSRPRTDPNDCYPCKYAGRPHRHPYLQCEFWIATQNPQGRGQTTSRTTTGDQASSSNAARRDGGSTGQEKPPSPGKGRSGGC